MVLRRKEEEDLSEHNGIETGYNLLLRTSSALHGNPLVSGLVEHGIEKQVETNTKISIHGPNGKGTSTMRHDSSLRVLL